MIRVRVKGNFKNTKSFLEKAKKWNFKRQLEKYGKMGVEALAAATPVDTGLTKRSWDYRITDNNLGMSLTWINTNIVNHVMIAAILDYGHGTRNGGYVPGKHFIQPAIKPIEDKLVEKAWKEVSEL